MCFALPKQIQTVNGSMATLQDGTAVKLGNIKAQPGDYILVIGPLAVEKISKKKAMDMLALVTQAI